MPLNVDKDMESCHNLVKKGQRFYKSVKWIYALTVSLVGLFGDGNPPYLHFNFSFSLKHIWYWHKIILFHIKQLKEEWYDVTD